MKRTSLAITALTAIAVAVPTVLAVQTHAQAAEEWTLAWQDEFNDPEGTQPSSSNWVYDTGGEPKWGNQEWQ